MARYHIIHDAGIRWLIEHEGQRTTLYHAGVEHNTWLRRETPCWQQWTRTDYPRAGNRTQGQCLFTAPFDGPPELAPPSPSTLPRETLDSDTIEDWERQSIREALTLYCADPWPMGGWKPENAADAQNLWERVVIGGTSRALALCGETA